MRGVSLIHDLACAGRITAHEGAMLLEMRRAFAEARRPRWSRALRFVGRVLGVV